MPASVSAAMTSPSSALVKPSSSVKMCSALHSASSAYASISFAISKSSPDISTAAGTSLLLPLLRLWLNRDSLTALPTAADAAAAAAEASGGPLPAAVPPGMLGVPGCEPTALLVPLRFALLMVRIGCRGGSPASFSSSDALLAALLVGVVAALLLPGAGSGG
ncbi:hypothetical protein COO60DRAFT_1546324 [Scenedesmus sp. NREL 46B-D3]|nr:hypothetical protein COO60DRAFT_1546324 [Scenedesmus sp. NREL 46B-D3]